MALLPITKPWKDVKIIIVKQVFELFSKMIILIMKFGVIGNKFHNSEKKYYSEQKLNSIRELNFITGFVTTARNLHSFHRCK